MNIKTNENNYLEIIKVYKDLIDKNLDSLPNFYKDIYNDTEEIHDYLKEYKKCNLLGTKYYSLLENIAQFINNYEIDVSSINESIVNKINDHRKIYSLVKVAF